MKNVALSSLLTIALAIVTTAGVQGQNEERLGLPGDNLNLYGVMKLFQESQTLEDFERDLNDPNKMLNNLDLNGDYQVDYINVVDYLDGNVHNIVLRVSLNRVETQDVAVFTVQPDRQGDVVIQLIGDEALYGRDYIIEPYYANTNSTPNPGYMGDNRVYYGQNVNIHRTTTIEVSAWPIIRFIFAPSYVCWHSPWYFGYYPGYWSPWRPYYWDYYSGYHYGWDDYYFGYYHRWNTYRYNRFNDFYYRDHRHHSDMLDHRMARDDYRDTYSRPDLRDQGSQRFHEMHPAQSGGPGNSNMHGNNNPQGNNQNMNRPANNQQGQGRPSTTTRPGQTNQNQAGRQSGSSNIRQGQQNVNQGQMNPPQGHQTSAQSSSGVRREIQNVNQVQHSSGQSGYQPSTNSRPAQQTTNRSTNATSSSRPSVQRPDKSGDRPTSVPGTPRQSMGSNPGRSSGDKAASQHQSTSKPASSNSNKSSGQKSNQDKSGRRK